jgi:DNA mismatch repair protein MutS
MRQHARFKQRYPDCLLLFRIGDFYELFDDDALRASKALGLTLTQRTEGLPMCGLPFHQLDTYLRRALAQGFRVAVCEQVQDAAEAKGLVERAVTRVLTPGTLVDQNLLEDDRSANLAAVAFVAPPAGRRGRGVSPAMDASLAVVAIVELSTGSFRVFSCQAEGPGLLDELARQQVTELLYAETADGKAPPRVDRVLKSLGLSGTPLPGWHFRPQEALQALREQFGVKTLAGFGLDDDDPLVLPAGAVVRYLRATQAPEDAPAAGAGRGRSALSHLQPPKKDQPSGYLTLDAASMRALEIDRTIRAGGEGLQGSLLGVFLGPGQRSACRTAMGKRLLRDWLLRPAAELATIDARHRAVATLCADRRLAQEIAAALEGVQDVPRLAARIALGRASPRDLAALGQSARAAGPLKAALANAPAFAGALSVLQGASDGLEPLAARVTALCVDAPPAHLREGGLIRDGVDPALDEARLLQRDAGAWLSAYQQRLIQEHQLPSLKVGFNKIFGYYIELPKAQAARAPDAFSRRQTLTAAERYITPELKEFEDKVTHAQARAVQREQAIFDELCAMAAGLLGPIGAFAAVAAELDVLRAFADKAVERRWCRPEMTPEATLRIVQGRHPVLDELLGNDYVPNDLELGGAEPAAPALALITGPNMAGKSTFIRQAALLVLLAHAGSFVPADSARIGRCDRIFTRVGADDALHAGQSTFMVEMTETANILHHATPASLVILDEIGRGTSTLDGLSLAWAIAETLAGEKAPGPRTLFATHYHELTRLQELLPGRVTNLHVSVREWPGPDGLPQIVFLHRILPGRTDRSYGIHVARLAGLPESTIHRARAVLESLSVEHAAQPLAGGPVPAHAPAHALARSAARSDGQLSLFTEFLPHPAVDALREIKLDALSPLQAFDELRRLQGLARADGESNADQARSTPDPA